MFVPHRKHTYGPPQSVTEIALHSNMQMMLITRGKHTDKPPRPVTGTALLLYM
jgi:hypothetical protein